MALAGKSGDSDVNVLDSPPFVTNAQFFNPIDVIHRFRSNDEGTLLTEENESIVLKLMPVSK